MTTPLSRKLIAEFIGTFLLVFLAVGTAVFGIAALVGADGNGPGSGVVGVAFGFGLVLLGLAYAFGPISGARQPRGHTRHAARSPDASQRSGRVLDRAIPRRYRRRWPSYW